MVGFYARFIPGYSDVAVALHGLTKKGVPFVWGEAQQKTFDRLKRTLCEAPVLQVPDFSKDFVLTTDASDVAVSVVLQQRVNGSLAPIAYYSRVLTPAERVYSTSTIAFLTLFFKVFNLQGRVPNTSAGSWFQSRMVLFTKEYFPISVLCLRLLIFRS